MQYTLGSFNKGKKVSNKSKGQHAMLKGQLKQNEKKIKMIEAELIKEINRVCDLIEGKENKTDSGNTNNNLIEDLKKYFETTPREKVLEDWAKSESFDEIGPTMDEFINLNNELKDSGNTIGK